MSRGMSLLRSFSMKKGKKSQLKNSSVTNTASNTLNREHNSSADLQESPEISNSLMIENVGSFVQSVLLDSLIGIYMITYLDFLFTDFFVFEIVHGRSNFAS